MIDNMSLLQDLETLGMFERALEHKALSVDFLNEWGFHAEEWVKIRFIHMSEGKSRIALTIPANSPATPHSSINSWKTEKGRDENF